MIIIGLTGGIGSGKSTVSNILRENGISIIDADIVSRGVLKKYPQIINNIELKFGKSFFDSKGSLKRKKFGNYIFSNKELRREYESIIIPYIKKDIFIEIERLKRERKDICVLDAATLIENKFYRYMNEVILVWVDVNTQINRVKIRDKLSDSEVIMRINSQMSLNEKKKYASFVLDNSGDIFETKLNLNSILIKIMIKYKGVKCSKLII